MKKFAIYRADGTRELVEMEELNYEFISETVGGDIEFYKTTQGDTVYLNESGRLENLPPNPFFHEDIRGDVVLTGGVDEDGEDKGLPNDYKMLKKASLPDELFIKGNKFTIFAIGKSLPMTFHIKITTQGYEQDGKPIFKAYRERRNSVWTQNIGDILIFHGWELPFQANVTNVISMNGLYNLSGMSYEEMAKYILENQINPFFISYDKIVWQGEGKEKLLFPHHPPSSQRIADMQSEQLQDGISRIVI